MTDIRVTQDGVEVLQTGTPGIAVTHTGIEVLQQGTPGIALTHIGAEVLVAIPLLVGRAQLGLPIVSGITYP